MADCAIVQQKTVKVCDSGTRKIREVMTMQHTVSAKERWMRIGAVVLAVVMVFFAMTAAIPGA